jgi:glutamate-1-semialdehyde aminotransferase
VDRGESVWGGAVVRREDVMSCLTTQSDPEETRRTRIAHAGTFNANPLSAAAGTAISMRVLHGES